MTNGPTDGRSKCLDCHVTSSDQSLIPNCGKTRNHKDPTFRSGKRDTEETVTEWGGTWDWRLQNWVRGVDYI